MWHTSEGVRKLAGAERRLFVTGLLYWVWQLHLDEQRGRIRFGVEVLDQILPADRPFVFLRVAEDLLGDGKEPELRAWNEAVVHACYRMVTTAIEMEAKTSGGLFVRQAVRDAAKEAEYGDVLWDRDFLSYETFADLPPDRVAMVKAISGIDEDYYTDGPPALAQADRDRLDAFHQAMLGENRKWRESMRRTGRISAGQSGRAGRARAAGKGGGP